MNRFNITFLFILFVLLCNAESTDFKYELIKKVSKEYNSSKNSTLNINNRYGKVELITWDKSSVKIDVEIIIKANNKSIAEDRLSDIFIDLSQSGTTIKGVTSIESRNTSWWSAWWENSDKNTQIEINYTVRTPSYITFDLSNKYGNIYLPHLSGKTTINLKYGNLEAKDIQNNVLLNLSYGKATMGSMEQLQADLAYSSLRCFNVGDCILTTKYSKIHMDDVENLTANSKYDGYKMGYVNTLKMDGAYNDLKVTTAQNASLSLKYTGVYIENQGKKLNADIAYGSLTVDNLLPEFRSMNINSRYGPIKINSFVPTKVNLSGKYCSIKTGSNFIKTSKEESGSSIHVIGHKIKSTAQAAITITSSYGDILLK